MFITILVVFAVMECFSFIGKKKVGVFHLAGKGRCVVAAAIGHKVHQAELVRPPLLQHNIDLRKQPARRICGHIFVAKKIIAGSHHHIVGAACKIVIIKVL